VCLTTVCFHCSEAMAVDEAERRGRAGAEEALGSRLGRAEQQLEYLAHRLEVLEYQVGRFRNALRLASNGCVMLA
jgi:hypothetical protein